MTIPKEKVVGMVIALFVLLIVIHILLTIPMILKYTQNVNIQSRLEEIKEEWQKAEVVKSELRVLKNKLDAIEKVTTEERISWTKKLNDISDSLIKGVWINKISLDDSVLLIDGSAVSKEQEEMTSPYRFTENLKSKEFFMKGMASVEVSSVQRRQIKSIQIADFLITARLKK